ncbi:MAG: hypothetical protein ACI3ZC_05825 [Candidatus Cryptobacteroides sp.]
MSNIIREILVTAIICFAVCGCEKHYETDPVFIASSDVVLKVRNTDKMVYSPETCQIGFRKDLRQFRVNNDNMSEYFIFTTSAIPEKEGQTLKGSIIYESASESYRRGNLSFKVERTDNEGTFWLWCKDKGTGVVVRVLN